MFLKFTKILVRVLNCVNFLIGVVKSYEISCYSASNQNKQASGPVYASCFAVWCPSEGIRNI